MKRFICLAALLSPTILYALECMPFAVPMGKAAMAMTREVPALQECVKIKGSEGDACLVKILEPEANNGNYSAAVLLAEKACEDNNLSDLQKWLTMAINSPKIPQADKDELTKILNTFGTTTNGQ